MALLARFVCICARECAQILVRLRLAVANDDSIILWPPGAADAALRLRCPANVLGIDAFVPRRPLHPLRLRFFCHRQRAGSRPDFHGLRQFKSVSTNKKAAIPVGMTAFLGPTLKMEPVEKLDFL